MNLLYLPIHSQRIATTPGTSCRTLLEWCVGSLTSHIELMNMEGICKTGPAVYSPYPRLESLTISGCNYKASTFSSVISKTLSVGSAGVELTNSRPPEWQPSAQPTGPPLCGTAVRSGTSLKKATLNGYKSCKIGLSDS